MDTFQVVCCIWSLAAIVALVALVIGHVFGVPIDHRTWILVAVTIWIPQLALQATYWALSLKGF